MPGRGFLCIASACSGISGRLQASGAGDRSSVLISPATLKMLTVMLSGTSGRQVSHSASAQLFRTACACALPWSALALTSWNWSSISSVFFKAAVAVSATPVSSSSSISGPML